jgi:hypothetical protein
MNENETIKDRLYRYLDFKEISPSRLEKKIQAGGSYFNNVKTIGSDKLLAISKNCTDLNIDWLVTGEGNMLKSEASEANIDYKEKYVELLEENRKLSKENRELSSDNINLLKENRDLCRQLEFVKKGKVFEEV